ncbi:hypothetical protein BJ508DRAFT_349812 [Ascobolus immersus RN42]|uniref:Uncharacterized protein n=1 Tax=Ascobolus immersus RN42 TaxID=1160509 RepID=A0A3N4HYH2_ASCIM|nr:hypothetical protein BJ508DRAFT_349812 [Ascobolus immersus RN42]
MKEPTNRTRQTIYHSTYPPVRDSTDLSSFELEKARKVCKHNKTKLHDLLPKLTSIIRQFYITAREENKHYMNKFHDTQKETKKDQVVIVTQHEAHMLAPPHECQDESEHPNDRNFLDHGRNRTRHLEVKERSRRNTSILEENSTRVYYVTTTVSAYFKQIRSQGFQTFSYCTVTPAALRAALSY